MLRPPETFAAASHSTNKHPHKISFPIALRQRAAPAVHPTVKLADQGRPATVRIASKAYCQCSAALLWPSSPSGVPNNGC